MWVRGTKSPASGKGRDFCAAFVPWDGGPLDVRMLELPRNTTPYQRDAFVQDGTLGVVIAALQPRRGVIDGTTTSLFLFHDDGSVTRVPKIVSAAPVDGRMIGIRDKATDQVGRIDPDTGRFRPLSVGDPGFIPTEVAGGGTYVAVRGSGPNGPELVLLDRNGKERFGAASGRAASMPFELWLDDRVVGGTVSMTNGSAIQVAPIGKEMEFDTVARCKACFYHLLAQVPGGAWYAELPDEATGTRRMVHVDSATGTADVTLAQDPGAPPGFVPRRTLQQPPPGAEFVGPGPDDVGSGDPARVYRRR